MKGDGEVTQRFRDEHDVKVGLRAVRIYTEMLTGDVNFWIDGKGPYHWLPPHEADELEGNELDEALDLLCRHFDRHGITYELVR